MLAGEELRTYHKCPVDGFEFFMVSNGEEIEPLGGKNHSTWWWIEKKIQVGLALFKEFPNSLMHDSDIRREAYKKQRYTDSLTPLFPVILRHDYPRALYLGGKYILQNWQQ